jgi:hypothetical protein
VRLYSITVAYYETYSYASAACYQCYKKLKDAHGCWTFRQFLRWQTTYAMGPIT